MRRLTGLLLLAFLISGYVPDVAHALALSESAARQDVVMNDTDDIAACADDPAPSMNGRIPGLAGKPINLLAGAETTSRTDLTIGNLYPIAVRRTYNSRSGYDSPVGYGWGINYDRRLYTYPDGSVTLRKECGWKRRFTWSVSGFVTPLGESGTLVQNADGSYTYTDKSGARDIYDPQGRLIQLIDATGASITITYTAQVRDGLMGLLLYNVGTTPLIVAYDYKIYKIEEKNASGNLTGAQVTFAYDLNGRLTSITDNRRIINYGHDEFGNLTSVTGPETSITYGYTDANNMHRMTSVDEGKGAYVNTFDSNGRVTRQTHGTGVIDFEYITPYKKTKVTTTIKDSSGTVLNTNIRTVEFGENGQVIKETDTLGNVSTYARNSQTKITREEYWENTGTVSVPVLVLRSATDYTYDAYGNMKTKTEASKASPSDWDTIQKTTTYIYRYEIDPQAPAATFHKLAQEIVKSVVDPNQNRSVTSTYDNTTGNLLTTTDAGLLSSGMTYSYTTTYGYTDGKLTSIDGPRTDVTDLTSYVYDPTTGFLTSTTQPLIGTTTYSNHDALGNPRTVTDPNGNSTTYTYDDTGRVLTVTAAGDASPTQYFYVAGGCTSCGGANKIDHITLPEGNTITYGYDANSNLASISDSLGNSINYTYDSEGNRLTEEIRDASNSLQKSLSYQYDALNKLKRTTNPDASYTEYSYDSRGNKSAIRNPNSAITSFSYDALNRLTSTLQPLNASTSYGYNSNNNLTTVTDANNNVTTYVYDDKGSVYQVISPDTGTTTYTYDPAGNLSTKTDAKGVTISYSYDALNRLTTIDYPADTDTVYSYDTCVNGKGRLCSMTDASGTTSYEYTPKGQVKKETKVIDTVTYVTQYTYDMNGNMKTMTYPSGKVITYNYSNERAVSVLNGAAYLASNITHKPFGGMNAITYGNGLSGTIGYDNQYRISSITAGAVLSLGYTGYDNNGNITAITDSLDATKNKSFTYDNLDRLWTATSTGIWGSLAWTYDGVGNRQTENTNVYTYYQNTNKLNTANGMSFGYDNNGNTTTEAARQYVYNQNQRLIQLDDGAMTANYTYNGNGQRVKKVVNGATTIFHYSLSGQIIAESNSAGNIAAEYVYLNGQPLAKMEGANTYFYHNDHLGTPQKMTDSTGAVVWAADYKPFGEVNITTNDITNNLRFPGQYYDAETGLYYNYMRDYNPTIGRYIEADPFGIDTGKNHLYGYSRNNSLRFTDLFGLWTCPTSRTYRACDDCGCGSYRTSRDNGARTHAGVDVCAEVNDTVSSPLAGTIENIDDGVRITGRVNGIIYSVRIMHFTPSVTNGHVAEGATLGTMGDMTSQYSCRRMTNHVHVEIYRIEGGATTNINPTTVLPCGN